MEARAYSSLAQCSLELATENAAGVLDLAHLQNAGTNANDAVALGLISRAAMKVALTIESAGFRRPEDNRFPEYSTEGFERLTHLWEAFDARRAEMAEEYLQRESKISKDPLSYSCAAEECGIVATKKSALRRCAGKCPAAFKPSYCSKYCQKAVRFFFSHSKSGLLSGPQDWKHHRPFCRPDATESSVRQTDSASPSTPYQQPVRQEGIGPDVCKLGPGRTININLGGGRIYQIIPNITGPQPMIEMQKDAEKVFRRYVQTHPEVRDQMLEEKARLHNVSVFDPLSRRDLRIRSNS